MLDGRPDSPPITIALAKGALLPEAIQCLQQVGIDFSRFLDPGNRLLRIESPTRLNGQRYEALLVRTHDVPVYVEYGQAQLGIVGYDVLRERYAGTEARVAHLLDLQFGHCRMSVALPQDSPYHSAAQLPAHARVASKFVGCAREYFDRLDLPVELISLYGSVELAPLTGMADAIVDLVATGRTLRENGLIERDCLFESTARLIAHPISYRVNQQPIRELVTQIRERWLGSLLVGG
ncbi:ATP phosphoribosyltransferase [Synechococcus sp. R60.3]|jgi:ATP phosphoribosyltransferase|uniref:ATP phosphoribosyltransferase n=1 Tax=unclassified Synechococcus TaxID=2626047 RepID=UPI0039C1BBFC